MSLPPRLWLPDSQQENKATVPASYLPGLWTPTGSGAQTPTTGAAPAAVSPLPRLRRRALLRGEGGVPDRPVLVEWFPREELEPTDAQRRKGLSHLHLLRLHHVGLADAQTAYAISEAPAGVDLLTITRAAAGQLPIWWCVAVMAATARALMALHQHLAQRGRVCGHGGVDFTSLFVGWNGAVQLLAYAPQTSRVPEGPVAPEVCAAPQLLLPASDVYSLGVILRALLPRGASVPPSLLRLTQRCTAMQAEQRPLLSSVYAALTALLLELKAPLHRTAAIGEELERFCRRDATSDLADASWGSTVTASFATLPSSLLQLSTTAVTLSPTWAASLPELPAPPQPPLPRPRPRLLTWGLGGLVLGALTWLAVVQLLSMQRLGAQPAAISASPPSLSPEGPRQASPELRPVPGLQWQGLRLQLLRIQRQPGLVRLWLRATNPGPALAQPDWSSLRLGLVRGPLRLQPTAPPQEPLGAHRARVLSLDYPLPEPPTAQPPLPALPEGSTLPPEWALAL